MEDWEALDVDDSDLPSLLRPCINTKRKHHHTVTSLSSPPPSQSQTLTSPPSPEPEPDSTRPRRIPGPAGAAQAAMARKEQRRKEDDDVSTQEFNRRAVEDDDDRDEDFELGPWLCAVEFVSRQGLLPSTPLSSVPEFLDIGRIDRVFAVIKSCTPNGLGDMMVTLKDPTGTIGASIHRKVFAEGEFGKEICVGSVLILQKVAVFSPSRSAFYFNIMQNNVVKVISKDSGTPTKQNAYTSAFKPTSGHNKETSVNAEEVSSMEVEINNSSGQCTNLTSSVNNNKEMRKETFFFVGGDKENGTEVFRKEITSDEQRGLNSEEMIRTNGIQKEKLQCTVNASLPEWTDEQLNELFTAEYADDGMFF